MKFKSLVVSLSLMAVAAVGSAQPAMPRLSSEQKTCLEARIGKPSPGSRPSPEEMKTALEACGVQAPDGPPIGLGQKLNDEQKACLEEKIGKPESGARPSREQMDGAFRSCGIERPRRPIPWTAPVADERGRIDTAR